VAFPSSPNHIIDESDCRVLHLQFLWIYRIKFCESSLQEDCGSAIKLLFTVHSSLIKNEVNFIVFIISRQLFYLIVYQRFLANYETIRATFFVALTLFVTRSIQSCPFQFLNCFCLFVWEFTQEYTKSICVQLSLIYFSFKALRVNDNSELRKFCYLKLID